MDDTDWSLIDFGDRKPAAPDDRPAPGQCPKCGRHIGRGIAVHIRNCKGASDARTTGTHD